MPGGDHGSDSGGRLYCTVMALLCLEEHYRHLRIVANAGGNQGPPEGGEEKKWGNENAAGKAQAPPEAARAAPADAAAAPPKDEAHRDADAKAPRSDFPLE